MTSPISSRSRDSGSLLALVLVVFVAMTGFGIFIPIFPFLGLELGASATAITIAMGAYSVGQLIAAPLWGRLSDRIGRKPVLILGLVGAAGSYAAIAYADNIVTMGLARLAGGLMAGNIGAAFAAAADLANERTRARNMGFLGAAFGFGFIIGPALGAFTIGETPDWADFQRVCLYATGFAAAAALAALVFLRETAPLGAANAARAPVSRGQLLRSSPILMQLVLVMFLMITAQAMMETIFGVWADHQIGWTVREVGYLLALVGLITVLLQGGGAGPLARRFGERPVLIAGLILFIVGFVQLSFAATPTPALIGLGVLSVGAGLAMPALQSLIAGQAPDDQRGSVMGLSQSATALGRAIGTVAAGPIFDAMGHNAPYLFGAVLLVMALLPAGFAQTRVKPG